MLIQNYVRQINSAHQRDSHANLYKIKVPNKKNKIKKKGGVGTEAYKVEV